MRAATSSLVTALCVVALAGCTSSEPSAPEPSTTATVDASPSWMPPTDVSAEVVLPGTAWDAIGPDDVREESEGVVAWRVEVTCDAGNPADAVAMRTVTRGSGELESRVGVQQVAAFADADAAVAETDRLTAALTACAATAPGDSATFVVEPLAVGAQGIGLATSYYGGLEDDAMGTYLGITRRGNAVTLVAVQGGEGTVGTARDAVTANAQAAWELLCPYDSAGC